MQMSEEGPEQERPKQSAKLPREILMPVLKAVVEEMWRQRQKSVSVEENEKITARLRVAGTPDEHIPFILALINAVSRGFHDDEEAHRLDRYLVGGSGIIDLYLFQMLASVGATDAAVHLSWIAMVISLPCAVGSLFFSFVHNNSIKKYGRVHSWLSAFAIYGAMISATSLIWHFWLPAGVVFLVVSIIVSLLGLGYAAILRLRKYLDLVQSES